MLGVPWLSGSFLNEGFVAAMGRGQGTHSPAILCSSPPGLTDEEIDVAFQQSGTAADEPAALGSAAQVVPVQPPHLVPQPYSKSPAQLLLPPRWGSGLWPRAALPSPRLSKPGDWEA